MRDAHSRTRPTNRSSNKTIRCYEGIGLLPPPARQANNYLQYTEADVEHLRFIASARSFGFSLADIATILAIRDAGIARATAC